jgi:uncharacterized protein
MTRSPIVDAHVHVLPPRPGPSAPKRDPYDIWEYGDLEGVNVLEAAGTIEQVVDAMQQAHCDHFVVVNMFVPDNELAKMATETAASSRLFLADRRDALEENRDALEEKLTEFNRWALDLAAGRSDLTPFVAADPHVLGGRKGADHLRWAVGRGARGIKIHPIAQAFLPDDPAMYDTYRACAESDAAVIAHAGAAKGSTQWAEPNAYAAVLRDHPDLQVVLAHLGGARWRQAIDLAAAFPNVSFDLCEIVAWVGAPGAPTRDELATMIREIGADRVLFGTDYPWYDVEATIDQVMDLPHLSVEEKEGILGANAIRILGLAVRV